ncbi:hypothetical protein WJX72_005485 [[Myrmecia] bisecta]|uniref:hydroxymethylglutaryl-CoA lyase n=1 Tax=[Myrmecia] bisecta TaxID=41462 RepID=A0AAW1QF56_9CHLO
MPAEPVRSLRNLTRLARGLQTQTTSHAENARLFLGAELPEYVKIVEQIHRVEGVQYPVLTPNLKGFERAVAAGAKQVAVFAAASEAFSQKNINCSIGDSLKRYEDIVAAAKEANVAVRGYVSCVVGCPYQGQVHPHEAAEVAAALHDMGCYEVSMGDTIGVGTPASVAAMFEACKQAVPVDKLAAHMHDTYGQAVANILASLQLGISVVDASVAGLGGCPYAKGATGNVATEDVVYLLNGFGIKHGVDMDKLLDTSDFISKALGRQNSSRLDYKAGLSDVPADAKDLAGALRIPARDVELLDPQGWQDPPTAIYLRAGAILVCLSGLRLVICKDQVTVLSVPDRHQPGVPVPPSSDHPAVQELILFLRPSQYRDSAQRRIEVDQSLPYELRALEGALSAATQDLAQHIAALEERITAVLDFLVQKVTSAKLKELLELKLALQKLSSYASRFKQELDRLLSDPRRLGEMYLTRMSGLASGAGPPGSTEPSMLGGCMQAID